VWVFTLNVSLEDTESLSSATFGRRLLRWSLFVLPIAYLVRPLGSLIHEVLGHGLVAVLYGGEFKGFYVDSWGNGTAHAFAHGFEIQMGVAGAAAEAVFGLVAAFAAGRTRHGTPQRLALLILSLTLLESACFAVVMGGFHEDHPSLLAEYVSLSDFAKVVAESGHPGLRPAFALLGTVAFVTVALGFSRLLAQEGEASFGPDFRRRGWRRGSVLLLFILCPGLWWFHALGVSPLDWITTYPPCAIIVLSHPGIAGFFAIRRSEEAQDPPEDPPGWPVVAVAIGAGVLSLMLSPFVWNWPAGIFK